MASCGCCSSRRRGGCGATAAGGAAAARRGHHHSPRLFIRKTWCLFFFSSLISFLAIQWLLSRPPPPFLHPPPFPDDCSALAAGGRGGLGGAEADLKSAHTAILDSPYVLRDDAICSTACGGQCFPRVRGLCISHELVTVCCHESEGGGDGTGNSLSSSSSSSCSSSSPSYLRFAGKDQFWRRNVKIQQLAPEACKARRQKQEEAAGAVWISGTQMVADMKMMPNGHHYGPSPHHEAEKLVPAIVLSQFYGLNGSSLHWFTDSDPSSVTSAWTLGMVETFADVLEVKFSTVPGPGQPPVCFEDAVLFSGVTNAGYVPNTEANDWLRDKVLAHCRIRKLDARRPAKDVVILHRQNSSRAIENADVVHFVLEKELGEPVMRRLTGEGDFCWQVKVVAEGDVFVTPHGSHNVNFLFARPGAIVLEAFPLLYYIDWFRNYLHSARLNHRPLFGTWPAEHGGMPFKMAIYAMLFGWRDCFSVRQCMNYAKKQNVYVDTHQLERLLH